MVSDRPEYRRVALRRGKSQEEEMAHRQSGSGVSLSEAGKLVGGWKGEPLVDEGGIVHVGRMYDGGHEWAGDLDKWMLSSSR